MTNKINYKDLIKQIYLPPRGNNNWSFEHFIGHTNIRYFSLGRYALKEALSISGIGKGDNVLLPEFICKEVLSSINSVGAIPIYYPVDKGLQLSVEIDDLPHASASIVVNYFGFSQDLTPFYDYCKRTGALLIEDNAHGLFSWDEKGQILGTRCDLGIFSFRKTVPVPNGAAIVVNSNNAKYKLRNQLPFDKRAEPFSFKIKQALRKLSPRISISLLKASISFIRDLRKLRTGYEIAPSVIDAEYVIPCQPSPCKKLFSYLSSVDIKLEIMRRRELYVWIDSLLKDTSCEPIFKELPDYTVPYAYPFYASDDKIKKIKKKLKKYGLECFRWPELPESILHNTIEHYRTVWIIQFLW